MSAWQPLREKLQGLVGARLRFVMAKYGQVFTGTLIEIKIPLSSVVRITWNDDWGSTRFYELKTLADAYCISVDRDCRRPSFQELADGSKDSLPAVLTNMVLDYCDPCIVVPAIPTVPLSHWFIGNITFFAILKDGIEWIQ